MKKFKEIESEESFQKLEQLLIEKIVVFKFDVDRRKIKLDIYANALGKNLLSMKWLIIS